MIKRLLLAATALFLPATASAKWHEASSAHFVVYSDQDPEKLRAFATKLERFDKAMRVLRGLDDADVGLANRLSVYVVPDMTAVQRLAGGDSDNVAGFYVGRASGSFAFVPRKAGTGLAGSMDVNTIFFHEYSHHLMLGSYTGAIPAWLTEGFAEFHSTAKFEQDGRVGLGLPATHRFYGAMNGGRLPLPRMLDGSYKALDGEQTEILYGRGWLLTHYLHFEPARSSQLTTYLEALNSGKPASEAATGAFGDLKKLDKELDAYVKRRRLSYLELPADKLPTRPVTVRALRPGEAAMMPVRMRSVRGVDQTTAKALVAPARRAAAPHPNDPVAQAWLAEIEHDAGNLTEAEAAADRALAADPKNGNALIYKGRIKMAQAVLAKSKDKNVWRDVRRWFIEASRADNEDAEPKLLFHSSFAAAGAEPTRNAVEALVYAQKLVPQDSSLRMRVVHQHLKDGKLDDAKRLLGPLAYSPHGGPGRDFALQLMGLLNSKDAKAALALANDASAKAEAAAE